MDYVVYCDESRHAHKGDTIYIAIGSLWVPRPHKTNLTREFRALCASLDLNSQIKWNKVSHKRLEAYKHLVDFFFARDTLQFRVIVVNSAEINRDPGDDRDLGVYKFYNLNIVKGIEEGNQYLVLLDFKNYKDADIWKTWRTVLKNSIGDKTQILDLTVIDARKSPLAQLCDLLTGAVAASWCDMEADSPKAALSAYIAQKLGLSSVQLEMPKQALNKFNIFTNSVAIGA